MTDKMNASEAVYGFAAWLTTREEKTVMGGSEDCAPIADLVSRFCEENNLDMPRNGWENNLTHPTETPEIIKGTNDALDKLTIFE